MIDTQIREYCLLWQVDYSRFVDDLTFSSNDKDILKMVEERVKTVLNEYGYRINDKKTKYICENKQQNVLGLVVNQGRVRLPKGFKRNVRSMLHHYVLFKSGNSSDVKHYVDEKQLSGYIGYIKHVDRLGYKRLKAYSKKLARKYDVDISVF